MDDKPKIATFYDCRRYGQGVMSGLIKATKPGRHLFVATLGHLTCHVSVIDDHIMREIWLGDKCGYSSDTVLRLDHGYLVFAECGEFLEIYWHPSLLSRCLDRLITNWKSVIPREDRRLIALPLQLEQPPSAEIGRKPQSRGPMYQGDS